MSVPECRDRRSIINIRHGYGKGKRGDGNSEKVLTVNKKTDGLSVLADMQWVSK